MFKSFTDIGDRLKSERNVALSISSDIIKEARGLKIENQLGRSFCSGEIPDVMKPVIGAVAQLESNLEAEAVFGVDDTTASDYAHDNFGKKSSLKTTPIEELMVPVRDLALSKMTGAMEGITDEKFQDCSAKTLSEIARNLAAVVKTTIPQNKQEDNSRYELNLFIPRNRDMERYSEIEIREIEEVNA